jgi:hypothetical protein
MAVGRSPGAADQFREVLLSIASEPPGWDALLCFSEGYKLNLFCDHVGDASFDGNWEVSTQDLAAFVGLGSRLDFEERTKRAPVA